MTANKPNNKPKWTAAGAAAKTVEPDKTVEPAKSAPEAPAPAAAIPAAAKSAPVAPSVKSEPVAPAPSKQIRIESPAVDEAVIAAALAPQTPDAPEASSFVEVVELEAAPVVAAQESVAGFAISASTPIATPEAAAWAFKSMELWSENAHAMMGFASALGKAKSLTEVVELQSRFATERFNRFAKLAGEVAPPAKLFFFAA
jgi:hypothetical protein